MCVHIVLHQLSDAPLQTPSVTAFSLQAANEEEQGHNQGPQSPYAGPSMGSPVRGPSEGGLASDCNGPLLRKLRNIHSLELERRLSLEAKPGPERLGAEPW